MQQNDIVDDFDIIQDYPEIEMDLMWWQDQNPDHFYKEAMIDTSNCEETHDVEFFPLHSENAEPSCIQISSVWNPRLEINIIDLNCRLETINIKTFRPVEQQIKRLDQYQRERLLSEIEDQLRRSDSKFMTYMIAEVNQEYQLIKLRRRFMSTSYLKMQHLLNQSKETYEQTAMVNDDFDDFDISIINDLYRFLSKQVEDVENDYFTILKLLIAHKIKENFQNIQIQKVHSNLVIRCNGAYPFVSLAHFLDYMWNNQQTTEFKSQLSHYIQMEKSFKIQIPNYGTIELEDLIYMVPIDNLTQSEFNFQDRIPLQDIPYVTTSSFKQFETDMLDYVVDWELTSLVKFIVSQKRFRRFKNKVVEISFKQFFPYIRDVSESLESRVSLLQQDEIENLDDPTDALKELIIPFKIKSILQEDDIRYGQFQEGWEQKEYIFSQDSCNSY